MKRKILSFALAAIMVVTLLPEMALPTQAAGQSPSAKTWFYDQLTGQGKKIYDKIASWYNAGGMQDGTESLDLAEIVDQDAIEAYLDGNRTLFNDFAAAKDAFDLEHPEAWYVDSSYLTFRVTQDDDGKLHAYVGPGRAENYYVNRDETKDSVAAKDAALKAAISDIVSGAGAYNSDVDKIKYVHKRITEGISYRFENECDPVVNANYIRTTYALVTHQGVCEGYARSFQWVLNELGIPCVLIHGVQASGVPEDHMWTAVWLSSGDGGGNWYVVDPTWDDPVPLDKSGNPKKGVNGLDGGEHETYLLVGQDVIGRYWLPSGYVSTGTMEFAYPEIALQSHGRSTLEKDGLKIIENGSVTMEGIPATQYTISFKGMGVEKAKEAGYYFLVKMYDVNADGSIDAFENWYYPEHMLRYYELDESSNPYFYDEDDGLTLVIAQAEYVEFAITTKVPPTWETPDDLIDPDKNFGYYSGNGTDILAESGLLFNTNGGYEAPPYVKNVDPGFTQSVSVGVNYKIHIEFTEPLYRPTQADIEKAPAGKLGDLGTAVKQDVKVDFTGVTYAWGVNAGQPHTFANRPQVGKVTWLSTVCELDHAHDPETCDITGLEYNFTASKMWADDSISYVFSVDGLVGRKSNKAPGTWSYVFENVSAHCAYRCQGIDWNLWGQPQLLDNVNDLDLEKIALEGVSGEDAGNLEQLRGSMHLDEQDMNGRLMLVVENLSANRGSSENMSAEVEQFAGVDSGDVKASSMYEIDFARICKQTVVKTGQSLRLSVGFPAGFDASMEGITFKAYHFTRDIEGSCNITDADHVHTGLVTSVEEIPITVTQYGLIIMCNSFSPFMIMAVDADAVEDTSLKKTVTLVNDGNGTITASSGAYTRANGEVIQNVIQLDSGEVTFTIAPNDGYQTDTVTFSGLRGDMTIQPDENGAFTLSAKDLADAESGNAIISVTFVPKTVAEEYGEAATVTVCSHTETTGGQVTDATCTKDGSITKKTCEICGQVLSEEKTITAKGHLATGGEVTPATCEEPGKITAATCSVCGAELRAAETIEATGHSYKDGTCIVCGAKDPDSKPETPTVGFTDVPANAYYAEAVAWAVEKGITGGTTATTFSPNNACTRGQIVQFLWNAAGRPEPTSMENPFTDVKSNAYYYKAVLWAVEEGITGGTSPTEFSPTATCTRAQVVKFLHNRAKQPAPESTNNPFTDVKSNAYYYKAVLWAVEQGITGGKTATSFAPSDTCTRAQIVKFLYNAMAD